MELYLLLHSEVILVYIPLCVPARLLARALVRQLLIRKEDLGGKVVLITGASSSIGEVSPAAAHAACDSSSFSA